MEQFDAQYPGDESGQDEGASMPESPSPSFRRESWQTPQLSAPVSWADHFCLSHASMGSITRRTGTPEACRPVDPDGSPG